MNIVPVLYDSDLHDQSALQPQVELRHLDDGRRSGSDGGRELAQLLLGDRGLGPAGTVGVGVEEALHVSLRRSRCHGDLSSIRILVDSREES